MGPESQFTAFQGLDFAISIFCVATMIAMGLETTLDDVVAPLRNLLALAVIVLVNSVFVPIVGVIVITLPTLFMGGPFDGFAKLIVPLHNGQTIGFLLLVLASGSILGPTLAKLAGGTEGFARGTMIALVIASTLLLPVELELFSTFGIVKAPGFETGPVFNLLLLFQVLPLAVGIIIKALYAPVAVQLRPLFGQLAGLVLLIIFALFVMSSNMLSTMAKSAIVTADIATVTGITQVSPNETETDLLLTVEGASSEDVPESLKELPEVRGVAFPPDANVIALNNEAQQGLDGAQWAIVNPTAAYIVRHNAITGTLAAENRVFNGRTAILIADKETSTTESNNLNNRVITRALRGSFAAPNTTILTSTAQITGVTLLANLVIPVGSQGDQWLLVNDNETYLVALDGNEVQITQQVSQPLGVVGEFLKTLEQLPLIGPFVKLLQQLITIVWPYAMLAAIAAIIMIIGYYGGIAARNTVVGASGSGIPRTMASSTAVRNISFALILAAKYASSSLVHGLDAIGMVLIFYLMSLIVAAHKSVQWSREGETKDAKLEDLSAELTKDIGVLGAGGGS